MKGNKVVVTGLGAVTPLGLDVATSWQGICAGASGAANIDQFDASAFTFAPFGNGGGGGTHPSS